MLNINKKQALDFLEAQPKGLWDKEVAEGLLGAWCDSYIVNSYRKGDDTDFAINWKDTAEDNSEVVPSHTIAMNIVMNIGEKPIVDTDRDDWAEHCEELTLANVSIVRRKTGVGKNE